MKAKIALSILVALIVTAILLSTHRTRSSASLLLVNGIIHTVNERQPVAEAIAILGDRIVGLGTTEPLPA